MAYNQYGGLGPRSWQPSFLGSRAEFTASYDTNPEFQVIVIIPFSTPCGAGRRWLIVSILKLKLVPKCGIQAHLSLYTGLNYYLCDHNAKVQAGIEYQDLDTPDGSVDTLTYILAVRTYF